MTPTSAARVIGHRGAAARAPENTLAGVRMAHALGARWVELDVQITGDGCPILFHDARLERTTDGHGIAHDKSYDEIARLDAGFRFGAEFRGEPVPRLEDAVALIDALELGAVFEVKSAPRRGVETARAAAKVLAMLWPARLPPPLISSFDEAALEAARLVAPHFPRALIVKAVPPDWQARIERLEVVALHADQRMLDAATVAQVTARLPLGAYTVNAPERARQLFGWGVGAVFTDCPDVILSAVGHQSGEPASAAHLGRTSR
jgi:glycerophosphoryl diester phosphodiesterase